jgi:DNA-binding CsgD family transcriptional regulator
MASKDTPFAFALSPLEEVPRHAHEADRVRDLEGRLRRIATEVRAAGITPLAVAPGVPRDLDVLAELSPRQHEVLQRLVSGQRTPVIARELFLSQNTVRNHLSAIFRRFGVHSQSQLLERLQLLSGTAKAPAPDPAPIETERP